MYCFRDILVISYDKSSRKKKANQFIPVARWGRRKVVHTLQTTSNSMSPHHICRIYLFLCFKKYVFFLKLTAEMDGRGRCDASPPAFISLFFEIAVSIICFPSIGFVLLLKMKRIGIKLEEPGSNFNFNILFEIIVNN